VNAAVGGVDIGLGDTSFGTGAARGAENAAGAEGAAGKGDLGAESGDVTGSTPAFWATLTVGEEEAGLAIETVGGVIGLGAPGTLLGGANGTVGIIGRGIAGAA